MTLSSRRCDAPLLRPSRRPASTAGPLGHPMGQARDFRNCQLAARGCLSTTYTINSSVLLAMAFSRCHEANTARKAPMILTSREKTKKKSHLRGSKLQEWDSCWCYKVALKYSQTWVIRIWVVRNLGLSEFFARSRRNQRLYILSLPPIHWKSELYESLSCTNVFGGPLRFV